MCDQAKILLVETWILADSCQMTDQLLFAALGKAIY